jgi:hypothetical protein
MLSGGAETFIEALLTWMQSSRKFGATASHNDEAWM